MKIVTRIGIYPTGIRNIVGPLTPGKRGFSKWEKRTLWLLKRFKVDTFSGRKENDNYEFSLMPGAVLLVTESGSEIKIVNPEKMEVVLEGTRESSMTRSLYVTAGIPGFLFHTRELNVIEKEGIESVCRALIGKMGRRFLV